MTTITTRAGKGSPLSNNEMDANLTGLNDDKYESGDSASFSAVTVDNITIDGAEIDLSSGDLTLDVAGDIILDADGGDVRLSDAGTQFGKLSNSGTDLVIESLVSDRDMVFKGNDGGSSITALTLDMSAGGTAFFADDVRLTDNHAVRLGTDGDIVFYHDNSNGYLENGTGNFTLDVAGDIILDADSGAWRFKDGGGSIIELSVGAGSSPTFYSAVSDADIVFKGNDGGSAITALTLDMSAAGAATFNAGATFGSGINVTGSVVSDGLTVDASTAVVQASNAGGTTSFEISNTNGVSTANNKAALYLSATGAEANAARIESDFTGTVATNHAQDLKFYYVSVSSSPTLGMTLNSSGIAVTGNVVSTGLTGSSIIQAVGADSNGFADVEIKSTGTTGASRLFFSDTAAQSGFIKYNHSGNSMEFGTGGAERFTIDSGGNAIFTKANGAYLQLKDASAVRGAINVETSDGLVFTTGASFSERMRIDGSGLVGILNSSPSSQFFNNLVVGNNDSGDKGITIRSNAANRGVLAFSDTDSATDGRYTGYISYDHSDNAMKFHTNGGNERMRILSNGRVSIGSSPSSSSELFNLTATSGNGAGIEAAGNGNTLGSTSAFYGQGSGSDAYVWNRANSTILFGTNNTECARFGSSGDMEIGSNRVNQGAGRYLDIYNRGTDSVSFSILRLITEQVGSTSLSTSEFYKRKNGETTLWNHETSSDAYLRAGIGTTEAWRIHSSGNVLLGKSSPAFGTTGVELNNNGVAGKVFMTRSGGDPLSLNRLSSDGEILGFYKDSTTVGRLDAYIGYLKVYGGTGSAGSGLWFGSGAMYPVGATNVVTDNVMDIGHSSYRFQDIYASNGTIQTSDRNEKQDIEELSEAEQRVAVACKGLLRKFRWKSAVEEKGEDARIHFGIIAQDLQDAFTAEGLDAGRYGMFINSTWTDEETGEERSRMGVRYSELLAFIISAI